MTDIILRKKESIERCIKQIRSYYDLSSKLAFEDDQMRLGASAFNVARACDHCVDLANHVIRLSKLGLPKESRDSFRLLAYIDAIVAHHHPMPQ